LNFPFVQVSRIADGPKRLVTVAAAAVAASAGQDQLKGSGSASNLGHEVGVESGGKQFSPQLVSFRGSTIQEAGVSSRGQAKADKKTSAVDVRIITGPSSETRLSTPRQGFTQSRPSHPGVERQYPPHVSSVSAFPELFSAFPSPSTHAKDMPGAKPQFVQTYPGLHSPASRATPVLLSEVSRQAPPFAEFELRTNPVDARVAATWIHPGSAAMQSRRPSASINDREVSGGRKFRSEPSRAHPNGPQALLRARARSLASDVVVVTPGSKTARLCNNSSTVRGYGQYHSFRPPDLCDLESSLL
jgi:hypothetical protein